MCIRDKTHTRKEQQTKVKKRRTMNFDGDVYRAIRHYRGRYMTDTGKDKTFTVAVNELLREILTQKGFLAIKEG